MPEGAAHQFIPPTRRRPAIPGMPAFVTVAALYGLLINKDPQAAEVWTDTINTATDAETYGVNLTSPQVGSVSVVAGTGSSVTTIAAALVLAWNTDPICRSIALASNIAGVITFTGVYDGEGGAFAMEEDENAGKMTLVNTTDAAAASTVPFGRAMISTAYQSSEPDELGILAKSSKLTAQIDSYVLTFDDAVEVSVVIEIDGETYESVPFAMATNVDTAGAALVVAINLVMPAVTVLASYTAASDTLVLTAELAGKPFTSWVRFGVGADTAAAVKTTNSDSTPSTDFDKVFAGVSLVAYDVQQASLTTEAAEYPANSGVKVMRQGAVWVASTETVTDHTPVYVELDGTGSNAGKFYTTSSATRKKVSSRILQWKRSDHAAAGAWAASDGDVAQLVVNALPA